MRSGLFALLGIALTSCGPFSTAPVERLAGVTVTLSTAPTAVAPGDSVAFIVAATNATDREIQIGGECGPSMDVLVSGRGRTVSVLAELSRGGVFTCELGPHHVLKPGETQSLRLLWAAPAAGEYRAVAGLRRTTGLGNPSAPVGITVR